jgi:hypothetical protein
MAARHPPCDVPGVHLSRSALTIVLASLAGGCVASTPPGPSVAPPAASPALLAPPLRLEARAPSTVAFGSTDLGRNDALVAIRVTNEGDAPVLVGDLRVAFEVRRGATAFACERQVSARDFDAASLRPGESFTAETPLRCWTPLPGTYDGRAVVAVGGASAALTAPFRFEVTDPRGDASRPYPTRPGLYVLAGGALQTLPIPDASPEERSYHAVVVLVNATPREMALPPARVRLDVYRSGDPLPCTSQVSLRPVAPIPAGAVDVERIPVTCLRERRGAYEIHASVAFDDDPPASAGRFRVRVTDDLGVIVPIP